MDWWAPVVGLSLAFLVPALRDRWRTAWGRRRAQRVAGGRADGVRVRFGAPGDPVRATATRHGGDLHVTGRHLHVVVPAHALTDPQAGTWHVDREGDVWRRFALAGPGPLATSLDVPEHLLPALLELARRPTSAGAPGTAVPVEPARRPHRSGVLVAPAAGLLLTLTALTAGLGFQALYATGADVAAHVDAVVRTDDAVNGYACDVSWTDPWVGTRRTAVVDCDDPVQPIGSTTTVHALRHVWPGTAMDLAGSYEVLTALSVVALAVTGVPTLLLWRRHRIGGPRTVVGHAVPVRSEITGLGEGPQDAPVHPEEHPWAASSDDVDRLPLPELVRLVRAREGRGGPAPGWEHAARPTLLRLVVTVVQREAGWGVGVVTAGIALAGLWDSLPTWVHVLGLVVTTVPALVLVTRAASTLVRLVRLRRTPVTAVYDVACLATPEGELLALLCAGDRVPWMVRVPTDLGERRRVGVRGDPARGLVLLVVDGQEVMTTGPVLPVDDDLEDDLRGMVGFLLDGAGTAAR